MITTTLLLVLGILLAAVLWAMFRGQKPAKAPLPAATPIPIAQPAGIDLASARSGDVLSVQGAAEDFSDLDFTVDRRSAYSSGNRRWTDLSGEFRGRRVYLEVYPGPETEVLGILDERRLTLAELGLTENQLADLDARQDPSAEIAFEGKPWKYESSRELSYYENEAVEGEGLYRWLFREQDGLRALCVEKWENEPFDVRIAQRLRPENITVYKAT